MSYFGNEAFKKLNNEEMVEVVFEVPDKSCIENTILSEAVYSEDVNGYIYMKDNIKILIQDYKTAGRSDELAPHGCRVKIMKPNDCKGIEIKIDKNGDASFLDKDKDERPYKPNVKRKIDKVLDFTDAHGKELFDIWNNWKNEEVQQKLVDNMLSDNSEYKKAEITISNEKIKYPKKDNS